MLALLDKRYYYFLTMSKLMGLGTMYENVQKPRKEKS